LPSFLHWTVETTKRARFFCFVLKSKNNTGEATFVATQTVFTGTLPSCQQLSPPQISQSFSALSGLISLQSTVTVSPIPGCSVGSNSTTNALSTEAIVGISIGVAVFVAAATIVLVYLFVVRKKERTALSDIRLKLKNNPHGQ
jgi:hypothetical protein